MAKERAARRVPGIRGESTPTAAPAPTIMTERKLSTWVATAEIISAAAVVISLVYVGLEINRSTLESEADIQAELLTYTTQRRYLVIESNDLASLLAKGYADPGSLTPPERLRFQSYIELFYVAWERAFMTYDAGVLSEGLFVPWNDWFVSVAERDPPFVWPMVRNSQDWGPPFIQHVDRELSYPTSSTDESEETSGATHN